ncbi:prolyl oligopeptidase family serine peptidase [Tundrisphaera lichenicola]|uniref:prolyl oligopeptidase family serine peptidase n=1 Tax=Tundrisphaera lichenicola TaxID=2029860 RepID=UPI003EC09A17
MRWLVVSLSCLVPLAAALADGPVDNRPEDVRRVPKLGIEVSPEDRKALEEGLASLEKAIEPLLAKKEDPRLALLLPDVQVFYKAVHDALTHREFFDPKDIAKAKHQLEEGQARAEALGRGEAPWTTQTGLLVRGYVSKIDGSVQPYGLVVPPTYTTATPHRYRLDLWFQGRGETASEVNFIDIRERQPGTFTPADTIVLHPYGRYCNAYKFAGEVDVLEALEDVKKKYKIDDDRISVRGFSMGGAAAWQFGVHYSDRWFACNPGAGFSETPRFLKVFQKETLEPTWYEKALWHLYDCTDYAANLLQCPTVAYSGELDSQKQAADVMDEALRSEEVHLVHIIGPATKHAYHPEAREEVERRLDSIAEHGRKRIFQSVDFVTYTLKYNKMSWVTIDAMGEHWARASVRARLVGDSAVEIVTRNVTALTLDMPPGWSPLEPARPVLLTIDETVIPVPRPGSDRSWHVELIKDGDTWTRKDLQAQGDVLRKRHDLQGPIDDAFMDSFVIVRPTGKSDYPKVAGWVEQEGARAIEHWRRHFRGDARVKDDIMVTDADIASSNLILWGDPRSNAILKRIADKLPIRWEGGKVVAGSRSFDAETHAPILIYPNPLNPAKYVVLNSGFTFREYDYLNNARQVPKLPDWAIVDVTTPPDSRKPGKIAAADFFGEAWELRPARD